MPKALDLKGKKFGLLTVIEKAESKNGKTYWKCKCECGVEKEIQTGHLTSGAIKSCGSVDCKNKISNFTSKETLRTCEICGQNFIPNSPTRKYCYDCSPISKNGDKSSTIIALRQAMKKQAVKLKGGKCERCGYDKSLYALSFHHKNQEEKSFGLSANGNVKSWNEYLKEVEKCELLCANCHAEEHERLNKNIGMQPIW